MSELEKGGQVDTFEFVRPSLVRRLFSILPVDTLALGPINCPRGNENLDRESEFVCTRYLTFIHSFITSRAICAAVNIYTCTGMHLVL